MPVSAPRPVTLPLVVIAILSLVRVGSAQTVTVGPQGSGATFSDIAAGIAAAPPGGVVLVAEGIYSSVAPLVIDKPLTLLGAGSPATHFIATATGPFDQPLPLWVKDLRPGEHVVVAGIQLSSQATLGSGSIVLITDCRGPVTLAGVDTASFVYLQAIPAVAQVRDSAMVTLDGCSFLAVGVSHDIEPMAGLIVERSLVHINACRIAGASPASTFTTNTMFGGAPGIVAIDATVRIARSHVFGGTGNPPNVFVTPTLATPGAAAVAATGSQILVRGGPDNELRGGAGGAASLNGVPLSAPGGAAILLDPTSLGATTPDVVAVPGPDGNQQVNTPAIDGPGAFAPLSFPLATIAATQRLPVPGSVVEIELGGEPGAVVVPFLALAQVQGFGVPGVLGVVTLDMASLVPLPSVVLDAMGAATATMMLPATAALVGVAAYVQAISFGPGGSISVSGPTSFAVR